MFVRQQVARLRETGTRDAQVSADDLERIYSGEVTAETLLSQHERERLDRWHALRIAEQLDKKGVVRCKKCGYKRWFHKEYASAPYLCPGCGGEYATLNDDRKYTPNVVPTGVRITGLFFSLTISVYIIYALYTGVVRIPGKHVVMKFSGWAMLPASIALLMIAVHTLTYALDHYDQRNNEHVYESLRNWSFIGFLVAIFVAVGV